MPVAPIGTPLLGLILASLMSVASFAPASAEGAATEETAKAETRPAAPSKAPEKAAEKSAAPTGLPGTATFPTVPGAMPFTTCANCPPTRPKGGTAIINFVAPVTSNTMALLAKNAQNAAINGADTIRINISSAGGSVAAAQFAINVLKSLPVKIETAAMSQIASAAVALFCTGEKRYMGNGASLYLHQQSGYREVQEKTAAALTREYELGKAWYNGLLDTCITEGADRALLDYSSRDVVIDVEQAQALGMITDPFSDMRKVKTWGLVMNVVAPDKPSYGSPYPSFR